MSAPDDRRREPSPLADAHVELLARMRREFDASFASPQAVRTADEERLVILRAGAIEVACRIAQIMRFEADRKIVPLSGGAPGLLGLAGIRGKLVPVYGLATLLGQSLAESPRWLALCGAEAPVALAFDRLERFVAAPASDVCPAGDASDGSGHVTEVLRRGATTCSILDLASVLSSIRARAAGAAGRG